MAERRWLLRATAAGLAVVAMLGAGLIHPAQTDASWRVSEYAHGTFTAMTLQKPVLSACTYNPGLLGVTPVITVTWTFAAGTPSAATANYAASSGSVLGTLLGGVTETTTPAVGTGTTYTTTFKGSTLSGLAGATYTVGIQAQLGAWTSPFGTAKASSGLAGANASCAPQ